MQTPWFLELLAIGTDADERAIKRAYAARLKAIDPAADPEGFTHLRDAYEQARAWLNQPSGATATTHPSSATPGPAPLPPPLLDVVKPLTPAHEPAPIYAPLPDPAIDRRRAGDDPTARAAQVMKSFALRLGNRDLLDVAAELDACARELRKYHIDAPSLFEHLLLDALMNARVRQRAAVFAAAYAHFGWREVRHLASLGPAGSWVDAVERQRQAFNNLDFHRRENLMHWLTLLGDNDEPIPDPAARAWQVIYHAMAQYPRYLGLFISPERGAAWSERYAQATQQVQASARGKPRHVREHQAPRPGNLPPAGRSNHRVAGVACILIFGLLARILALSHHVDAEPTSTNARHVPGRTEAERSKAFLCMQTVDQMGAPSTLPTYAQATQLRECRLYLDALDRAESTARTPHGG